MFERLAAVEDEYLLLETSLADPAVLADQAALRDATKRYKDLTPLVEALRLHRTRVADVDTSRELMNAASGDERELWRAELAQAESDLARLEDEIRTLMLPKDPNDGKGVIIEIRGAEGGEEANLFARDLYEMYRGYASAQGWKVEVLSSDPSSLGGLNEVIFVVRSSSRLFSIIRRWGRLKMLAMARASTMDGAEPSMLMGNPVE